MKKLLIYFVVLLAFFAILGVKCSAAEFVPIEDPDVGWVSFSDILSSFFPSQKVKQVQMLPAISDNLAFIESYETNFSHDDSFFIHFGNKVQYHATHPGETVILTFLEVPSGTYSFYYLCNHLGGTNLCEMTYRTSPDQKFRALGATYINPAEITIREGERLQIRLNCWKEDTFYYDAYFNLVPYEDGRSFTASEIREHPFYYQLGTVYNRNGFYYQLQDSSLPEAYLDLRVLSDLGDTVYCPDPDYPYFKIYRTALNKYRIMWRSEKCKSNQLIYQSYDLDNDRYGYMFYSEELEGCFYSNEVYDSPLLAMVAMSDPDTIYTLTNIPMYEKAMDSEKFNFFAPNENTNFFNFVDSDLYVPGSSQFSNADSSYLEDARIEPLAFVFQNYSEDCYSSGYIPLFRSRSLAYIAYQIMVYNGLTSGDAFSGTFDGFGQIFNDIFRPNRNQSSPDFSGGMSTPGNDFTVNEDGNGGYNSSENDGDIVDAVVTFFKGLIKGDRQESNDVTVLLHSKFDFVNELKAIMQRFIERIQRQVDGPSARGVSNAPVLYVNFDTSKTDLFDGVGSVPFVDFSWYDEYKPTVDAFLSAIILGFFLFRLYFALPNIFSGTSSVFDAKHSMDVRLGKNRVDRNQYRFKL